MVFGLQLSFARVGSTVNFNVMVPIYESVNKYITESTGHTTLGITLLIATASCIFSLICSFILAFYDKRAERILKRSNTDTGEVVRLTDVKNFGLSFWMISFICVTFYVAIFPFTALGGFVCFEPSIAFKNLISFSEHFSDESTECLTTRPMVWTALYTSFLPFCRHSWEYWSTSRVVTLFGCLWRHS